MRRDLMRASASILCLLTALPATLNAQSYVPAPYATQQPDLALPPPPDEGGQAYAPYAGGQAYAPAPPQAVAPLSAAQLDQLLAPIALYPDDLLSQVLMASTYPLDVVEAARWVREPANAGLHGDALTAALEQQPWDPSVKALVPFPQVLDQLNQRLDWTQEMGQAFLAQQDAVMDSVQRLRQQAAANGALQSTPQQQVIQDSGVIEIQPADPTVVFVPSYDPRIVYGAWPYPDYPPLYFPPPAIYAVRPIYPGFAFFTAGILVGGAAWWGWHHWDWHRHYIAIDADRYARLNFGRPPLRRDVWVHDAARDRGFSQRVFSGRGFQPQPGGFAGRAAPSPNVVRGAPAPGPGTGSFANRAAPVPAQPPAAAPAPTQPRTFSRTERAAPAPQPGSFGQRPSVPPRDGFARTAPPPAQPQNFARAAPAPQPQAAPQPRSFGQRPSGPPRESVTRAAPPPAQPQNFARGAPPPQARPAPPPQNFARAAPPPPQARPAPPPQARPAPPQQAAQRPAGPPPQAHAAAPPQPQAQQQRGKGSGNRPEDPRQRETR